ncbi:MAG: helix-turn-helix domain-containing protein [Spirosomataceae bacterium]
MKSNDIPILDTKQLEIELVSKGGVPDSLVRSNIHQFFHINRVEDYFRMVQFPLPSDLQPRRITVYSFFFLTKGVSSRSTGLDTYDFGENTFYFTPAHQITTHKFVRRDVEGFYCHFSIELLARYIPAKELFVEFPFLQFNAYPLVVINEAAKKNVTFLLERLLSEYKAENECRTDILRSYLLSLFTELKPFAEACKPKTVNAASHITEEFKKVLTKHICEKLKITDYAEMLHVSPNHLNKCVKTTTGKSAHDLLNEMLLLEAKVLLKQTNHNITEIAYKIGKNEVTDFVRFFKAQTGLRPTEYRLMN